MEEGSIAKWLKQPGEMVKNGDVIAEVETDKATMDLIAYEDGVLSSIIVSEGASVPIGAVVAIVGEDVVNANAETAPAKTDSSPSASGKKDSEPEVAKITQTMADRAETVFSSNGASLQSRIPSSPLARKIARDAEIDLSEIQGSGPGGRIVRADVETAAAQRARKESRDVRTVPQAGAYHQTTSIPTTKMRQVTAKRLSEAALIPQFTLTAQVDLTKLNSLRQEVNTYLAKSNEKISVTDMLVKACSNTLERHPQVNASWDNDAILIHQGVDLGLAVALDDGLVVPVIRAVDTMSVREIANSTKIIIEKARSKKLTPDEMKGSTFTISNLGPFGIEQFTAILNPPEAAILAVGSAAMVPVVKNDQLVMVSAMKLTLSVDHRVLDGAQGASFLRDLVDALENPTSILL